MSFRVIDSSGWRWDGDSSPPDPAPLSRDDYARLLHLRARIALGLVSEASAPGPLAARRLRFIQLMIRIGMYSDYGDGGNA